MAVAAHVTNHISTNDLGTVYHTSYKQCHSTAFLLIQKDIHFSLSKGVPPALILLDLSAAFYTIEHATHLNLLKHMHGISGVVLKWFVSYPSNRCL